MILGPRHFTIPHRRGITDLKLAVGTVCKDLDLMCDLRLTMAWKIFLDDSERDAFISLVNERLK